LRILNKFCPITAPLKARILLMKIVYFEVDGLKSILCLYKSDAVVSIVMKLCPF